MKPIVVVGSINMDMVSRVGGMPVAAETIFGEEFETHTAAKGANQSVAIARLGHPSILIAKLRADLFGRSLLQALHHYGVDVGHVEEASESSAIASIMVDCTGDNSIIVIPGSNLSVNLAYIEGKRHVASDAAIVLAQLEMPVQTIAALVKICDELSVPLMLDPAPAQPLTAEVLGGVTWFTPKETEAQYYAGADHPILETVRVLTGNGVRNVIFKQGAGGAIIPLQGSTEYFVPLFAVEALDTTAVGDAYNGAFAIGLARGYDAKRCGEYASAAAALSVTRRGVQGSMATEEEVQALLKRAERNLACN